MPFSIPRRRSCRRWRRNRHCEKNCYRQRERERVDRENGKNQENEKRSHTQRNGMRSFQSITSTRTEPPPPSPPVPKPTTGKGNFRALYPPLPLEANRPTTLRSLRPETAYAFQSAPPFGLMEHKQKGQGHLWPTPSFSASLSLSLDERHDYQADYELSLMIDTHAIFCYLLATSTTTATPPTPPPSYCNPLIGLVVVVVSVG